MSDNKTLVRCDCGFEASSCDEATLVAEIQQHAWTAHGIAFTLEESLAVILRSELESAGRGAPPA